MSKTKFTKGDWFTHIVEQPFTERAFVRSKNNEGVLTLLETRSIANFEEQKANAVLISAAPDMFFALENLLSELEDCSLPSSMNFYIHNAKVSLNKAVGL